MKPAPNWSLSRQLHVLLALSILSALVAVGAVWVLDAQRTARAELEHDLELMGTTLADHGAPAINLDDRRQLTLLLRTIDGMPDLLRAAIVDERGHILAHYPEGLPPLEATDASGLRDEGGLLYSSRPIVFRDKTIGSVILESSLARVDARRRRVSVLSLLAVASVFVLGTLIARSQLGRLLGPLRDLASATSAREGSGEVARRYGNEIDQLAVGFDAILSRCQDLERQLEEHRDQLEREVEERTTQLVDANAKLRISMEQARSATQSKSLFLANMSHEIRTPMNGVLGMIELLLESPLADRQRDYAETIRASARDLLTVIDDILDFSKIEAGKLSLEPISFDLRRTVEDSAHQLGLGLGQSKDVEVVVHYDPEAPRYLVGDPGRIRQVLFNLIGNAIKFTEVGQVVVNVDCSSIRESLAHLHVEIRDTGPGLSIAELGHIFEKFTQADGSSTRRHGGTGLGLAISRRLVEMMGGKIGARSRKGEGSIFWFSLPLPLDTSPPERVATLAELAGRSALVVDDREASRQNLASILASEGMKIDAASSARRALRAIAKARQDGTRYDLIVIDHEMPEMNGEELAEALKADPSMSEIPLVLLSSIGRQGDASRLARAGVAGYLSKPVRSDELVGVVSRVLAGGRQAGPATLVTRHAVGDFPSATPRFRDLRVLVVEDHPINQKVARLLLEKIGCRVVVAQDGLVAIDDLEEQHFDLVLMDCQMPRMDGYEATARIRKLEQATGRPRIPIIAMTAHALKGEEERCLAAGMDAYLSKPVSLQELLETFEAWLPEEVVERREPIEEDRIRRSLEQLGEFFEGDTEALETTIREFLQRSALDLEQFRSGVEAGDRAQASEALRSMEGAGISLGLEPLSDLLSGLRRDGEQTLLQRGDEIEARLRALLERVEPQLAQVLREEPGDPGLARAT